VATRANALDQLTKEIEAARALFPEAFDTSRRHEVHPRTPLDTLKAKSVLKEERLKLADEWEKLPRN
jgi:hypothetical protein